MCLFAVTFIFAKNMERGGLCICSWELKLREYMSSNFKCEFFMSGINDNLSIRLKEEQCRGCLVYIVLPNCIDGLV